MPESRTRPAGQGRLKIRKTKPGQDGFVLLEVLIAGIVVGITMIGLSLMLSFSQTMVVGHGDEYVALYLAQQKIEQCISAGFGSTCTANSIETICYNCTTQVPVGESGTQTFVRTMTVTKPDANTYLISVTVAVQSPKASDPVTLVTQLKNTL